MQRMCLPINDKVEALELLDGYFGGLYNNSLAEAWKCIRKEYVEVQKPLHNSAMLEIALLLREIFNRSESGAIISTNSLMKRMDAVIAQLQQ